MELANEDFEPYKSFEFSMEQEVNEIRKTSISTEDSKTFACIDSVKRYHEMLNKIKTTARQLHA